MKKRSKIPSPFSIHTPQGGKTVSRSLRPRTSRQIKVVDAVKLFGLDRMDMTFDPAMINFRCLGNPANGLLPALPQRSHRLPLTFDRETEQFQADEFFREFRIPAPWDEHRKRHQRRTKRRAA